MTILFVARSIPDEKNQMNGIFEWDQARAVARTGCKVIYTAIDFRSFRRHHKLGLSTFERDGIRVLQLYIPCGRMPKPIRDWLGIIGLRRLLSVIVKQYGNPDIVHSHFIEYSFITKRALGNRAWPLVVTEHSSGVMHQNLTPLTKRYCREVYPAAKRVIAVSEALKTEIEYITSVKAVCIPNVVDLETFEYRGTAQHDTFNFISVGGLKPIKNMPLLIEAFYEAFGGDKTVTLSIFGEGPQYTELNELIRKLGLTDSVHCMGLCERTEIANAMQVGDCFVLASKSETFGLAYVEALASGLPVIATACGGPSEFIDSTNGILVPVNDKQGLIDALKYMRENSKSYDKSCISKSIKSKYSTATVADKICRVYTEVSSHE